MTREDELDVTTKLSPRSVGETVKRFLRLLEAKGQKLFAVIDQQSEARLVGLELRETTLVIGGNPFMGTPVMDAAPQAALDLPLKVLIWADGEETKVSYVSPDAIAARHGLRSELRDKLAGIDAPTNALIDDSSITP